MTQSLLKVFLSYASEDRERVLRLYENLKAAGFEPWIDVRDIPKGADWDKAIVDAIQVSPVFVACISSESVVKTGVLDKEIDLALTARQGRKVLLIPVRLDATPAPERLSHIQWIDLKDDENWRDVAAVIRKEEQRLSRRRWLVGAAAAVPLAGAGYLWWRQRNRDRDGSAGPAVIAANILRIRRAQPSDPQQARFSMSPTPNNGLTVATEMCTEQVALGDELNMDDLVLLRVFSSHVAYVYVVDQELSPAPGRAVALVLGDRVEAGTTVDLPPSADGTVSYFRFESNAPDYAGEQLTVLANPSQLKSEVTTTGGVRVLNPATWAAWQRDYPAVTGTPGAGFQRGWLSAGEGSKEVRVETASGNYKAPAAGRAAVAQIALRIKRKVG